MNSHKQPGARPYFHKRLSAPALYGVSSIIESSWTLDLANSTKAIIFTLRSCLLQTVVTQKSGDIGPFVMVIIDPDRK